MHLSITVERYIYIELNNKKYIVLLIGLISPDQVSVKILENIPDFDLVYSQIYIISVTKCSMTTTNIGKCKWEMTLFNHLLSLGEIDDMIKDHLIIHSWWYRENLRLLPSNVLDDLNERISARPDFYAKYSTSWIREALLRGSKIKNQSQKATTRTKIQKIKKESHEEKWKRWKE